MCHEKEPHRGDRIIRSEEPKNLAHQFQYRNSILILCRNVHWVYLKKYRRFMPAARLIQIPNQESYSLSIYIASRDCRWKSLFQSARRNFMVIISCIYLTQFKSILLTNRAIIFSKNQIIFSPPFK